MNKSQISKLGPGTSAYVIAHAKWRRKRGRRNSSATFRSFGNPRKALLLAKGEEEMLARIES